MASVAPLHGGSAPRRVAAGRGYRPRHHPVDDRLLDPLAVDLQADVLDLHTRHLFLYRSLFRPAQQSRAVPHAQYVHRRVAAGREYLQSHRGAVGGRSAERLVRRRPCHRCGVAAHGAAGVSLPPDSGRLIICIWPPRPSSPIRSAPSATPAPGRREPWARPPSIAAGCRSMRCAPSRASPSIRASPPRPMRC